MRSTHWDGGWKSTTPQSQRNAGVRIPDVTAIRMAESWASSSVTVLSI